MFYVMAEMWGSVVASLLFWSFANEVTTVDEAKKYCKLFNPNVRKLNLIVASLILANLLVINNRPFVRNGG